MPSIHAQRCQALEEHIGPVCTWPQWLRDAVQADHLSNADMFGLARTLLGNGVSPAHFASFVVGAGFVRDQRSAHKAKQLLELFRAGELRTYYDLSLKEVLPVRRPPLEAEYWAPAFAWLSVPAAALLAAPIQRPKKMKLTRDSSKFRIRGRPRRPKKAARIQNSELRSVPWGVWE